VAHRLHEGEGQPEHEAAHAHEGELGGGVVGAGQAGGEVRQYQGERHHRQQHREVGLGAAGAEVLLAVADRAHHDAQAGHAMQHQHHGGVDGVAQQGGFGLAAEHDRDDQAELDHRDRQGQQHRAEGLADPAGHHLGMVHGREHGAEQGGDQHCRRGRPGAAVQQEMHRECQRRHGDRPVGQQALGGGHRQSLGMEPAGEYAEAAGAARALPQERRSGRLPASPPPPAHARPHDVRCCPDPRARLAGMAGPAGPRPAYHPRQERYRRPQFCLHVEAIETRNQAGREQVRFLLAPGEGRPPHWAEAPVLDRRIVTDSGGHRSERIFILTPLRLAGEEWPIEINLTHRRNMLFPMLLGRTAMAGRFLVDPARSFVLGDPGADQAHPALA
jgi:hypothetical protein